MSGVKGDKPAVGVIRILNQKQAFASEHDKKEAEF